MEEYIKEIEQVAAKCTESQSDGYSQIMRICDAMREIDKQPIAFDMDKVVNQLKAMKIRYYLTYANAGNKTNDEMWEWNKAMDEVIAIVKGGGIDDR